MSKQVKRLFPVPSAEYALQNLYLSNHAGNFYGWHHKNTNKPLVVANFLSSLDGRIAVQPQDAAMQLPKNLTSKEDFRLFLELYAQADCLITHSGYLRALDENRLGNILQLPNDPEFEALHEWRRQNGLKTQPDIVIASSSMNFPLHASLQNSGQKIYIATGKETEANKINKWKEQGFEILISGKSNYVEGAPLVQALHERNYKHLYLIAGPKMLHTMLEDQQLHKLYLSSSHQMLAGNAFTTLLEDNTLIDCKLVLQSLFYDENSANNCGQFFSSYLCKYNN